MIRVHVDDERCQGNGVCARLAPEVFELRPGGVTVLQGAPGPALEAAVRDAA
ncbi:MAG: ferredoxin, partial [Acidimicrobiales bacterium]